MKKQRRKWSVLLSAALAVTCLAGCGNQTNTERVTSQPVQTEWQEEDGSSDTEATTEGQKTEESDGVAKKESSDTPGDAEKDETGHPYTLKKTRKYDSACSDDNNTLLIKAEYDLLAFQDSTNPDNGQPVHTNAPAIQSALDLVNRDSEAQSGSFVDENRGDAESSYQDSQEAGIEFSSFLDDENHLTVKRADAVCLSIARTRYEYLGGPHGMFITQGYNFDGKTGKKLNLSDILTDTDGFASALYQETVRQGGDRSPYMDSDAEETVNRMVQKALKGEAEDLEDEDKLSWYVCGDGVEFDFDSYQLGAYAVGSFHTTMKASDYPNLFNPVYVQTPDSYVREIQADREDADIEVNGQKLQVTTHRNDNGDIDQVTVRYGDKTVSLDEYGYELACYVITTKDSHCLYLNLSSDNEWEQIFDVDLDEETLTTRACDPGIYGAVLTDPDHMFLSTRTDLMSTSELMRSFHVGEHGVPEGNTRFWLYTGLESTPPQVLTLKQNVTLDVLDSLESDTTHKEDFQIGDTFTLFRTDNDQIVDAKTADGRYVRFTVDNSDWPEIINGQYNVEDLFDNTLFAG